MGFVKAAVRFLAGLFFGALTAFALAPAVAAFSASDADPSPLLVPAIVLVSAILCTLAPTIRKAFGRGFLIAGVSFFSLPVSTILLTGQALLDVIIPGEAAASGEAALLTGVAGLAVSGFVTLVSLIAGAIFVIIGLVLILGGRRREDAVDLPRR
ncbi:hypothetical protein M2360_004583 [Rhizobium sp. SG_E_25_P2]|uniref:hypothetical protein n=1 Tax=Rhizobium sp. SG_E_25_P2 TaxID=2879942 RepID=UPI00247425F8|nr:hypothetical protein [Rhizobium sp. SG_E_25_P2]MDH6269157.1 hypothetical protein [Rhizobium sp. SG_E_25_P2]